MSDTTEENHPTPASNLISAQSPASAPKPNRSLTPLDDLLVGEPARWLLRSALRDLTHQLKLNGKRPPPFAQAVLNELATRTGTDTTPDTTVSATGPALVTIDSNHTWSTTAQAAAAIGRSERHVRRLAATGAIRARRHGARTWTIDLDSLRSVIARTNRDRRGNR